MSEDVILDIVLDALRDSSLVFCFVFIIHAIISYIENKLTNLLVKRKHTGPLFGSIFGLVPQCGTSVLGADLYLKKYITIGSLIALFLSCSDEGLMAIIASGNPSKMVMALPLLGLKFAIGFIVGFIVDLIYRKQEIKVVKEVEGHTCHNHHHHADNNPFSKHFMHPLIHSFEIFIYVFVINLVLGFIIAAVGEENFSNFIRMNKYLSPLFASIVGLIPNCASSLLLSELFLDNSLSFGALLSGLLVNAGIGMTVLLKSRKAIKQTVVIITICFMTALIAGYITCLIIGF